MHYLLFYEVGEDYASRRAEFRDAHLQKAWKASERGELVLAGAFANPVNGAVLLFKSDSPEVAETFAREDPYVTNGAVKRWYVREWTTVAGEGATTPVEPKAVAASKEVLSEWQNSIQTEKGPVLRLWKGCSTVERASEYVHHATKKVFPALHAIDGHRGAYLLRRMVDGAIEFVVLTLWDSMAAVRRFAGAELDKAVVEPEARATLTSFDDRVTHYEIVQGTERAED
jgi:uncharacterized protein YciI/heme-degrading monooxygenase HmoA